MSVLQPLYAKMKDKPVSEDLPALWSQLGIQSDGAIVRFDDSATLAVIRRAITTKESDAAAERSLLPRPTAVLVGPAVVPSVIGLAK